jgi:hypothetical protein
MKLTFGDQNKEWFSKGIFLAIFYLFVIFLCAPYFYIIVDLVTIYEAKLKATSFGVYEIVQI